MSCHIRLLQCVYYSELRTNFKSFLTLSLKLNIPLLITNSMITIKDIQQELRTYVILKYIL